MTSTLIHANAAAGAVSPELPEPGGDRILRVAVVGGGIAGLSTAWHLQQRAAAAGRTVTYTLLERSEQWGGKVRTDYVPGYGDEPFIVEGGPDSFLTQKPWALQLARELGLGPEVLNTNEQLRKVFVLRHGKPVPLPDGVLLIIPTRFMPFALSPLLSPLAKLRMACDFVIPAKRDGQDETLADFVNRRLGAQALDRLAEPLMSGIYNAEADRQSVLATFPRFRELEEKHGSLIRGMLASRKNRPPPPPPGSPKPPAAFVSLRRGTYELIETLVGRLTGNLRLNTGVERVSPLDGGYLLTLTDGQELAVDAVVLAIPAYATAALLGELAPTAAAGLRTIRYVSTGTVSLGYRRSEIRHPLNGFGLVIPRSEERRINAVTWTSTKFPNRAPAGYALLRVFFGGSRRPEMMGKDDAELSAIVRDELRELMGIDAVPLFERIYRWHDANPQYDVGHLERVAAVEAALPPGVFVTGSPYRGVGLPDCVQQAQKTAQQVLERVGERK